MSQEQNIAVNLKSVLNANDEELREAGDVIIFIDELQHVIGAGAAEGAIDASNILSRLWRAELQAIGNYAG